MAIELKGETYLNPKEAAIFIGKAKNTIYCKYKSWGWKPYSYGASILFKKSAIEIWLMSQISPKSDIKEGEVNSQC